MDDWDYWFEFTCIWLIAGLLWLVLYSTVGLIMLSIGCVFLVLAFSPGLWLDWTVNNG